MNTTYIIILIAYISGLVPFVILYRRDKDRDPFAIGKILIWPLALFHGYFIKKQEHL